MSWYDGLASVVGDGNAYELMRDAHDLQIVQKADALGLSAPEAISIYAYTSERSSSGTTVFNWVNSVSRGFIAAASNDELDLLAMLRSGVTKMPSFGQYVFRRTTLPPAMIDEARNGSFCDLGYLSTSYKADVFTGKDYLIFLSRTGRDISQLSCMPQEYEIVFLPSTTFRVTRVDAGAAGTVIIGEEV